MGKTHEQTGEFHHTGPQPYFVGFEVSSLIGSNAVWNIMATYKAFCESTDGSSGRSFECREGKLVFRISVYSDKNKTLPFP